MEKAVLVRALRRMGVVGGSREEGECGGGGRGVFILIWGKCELLFWWSRILFLEVNLFCVCVCCSGRWWWTPSSMVGPLGANMEKAALDDLGRRKGNFERKITTKDSERWNLADEPVSSLPKLCLVIILYSCTFPVRPNSHLCFSLFAITQSRA